MTELRVCIFRHATMTCRNGKNINNEEWQFHGLASALPTEPCIIIIFVMAIINNVYWVTKCLLSKPIIIVLFLP